MTNILKTSQRNKLDSYDDDDDDIEEDEYAEDDDNEESRELSEKMRKLSMEKWINLKKTMDNSNAESLEEEMKKTLSQINKFIDSLEHFAHATGRDKPKKSRLKDRQISLTIEKMFNDRINIGMQIIDKINELYRLEKLDKKEDFNKLKSSGSICEFQPDLDKFLARFAHVLEARGIQHNLTVSPLARMSLEPDTDNKPGKYTKSDFSQYYESSNSSPIVKEKDEKELLNPVEFLRRVVSRNYLSLWFRDLPTTEKTNYSIYESACDLEEFTVTAKGRDRTGARNNSASKMIKMLLDLQKKETTISTRPELILMENEKETAIKIISEKENFALKLEKICEVHTTHEPVYTTLSEKPVFNIQCHALGFMATGSHHDFQIAKRVAAKRLLDSIPFNLNVKHKHPTEKEKKEKVKKNSK